MQLLNKKTISIIKSCIIAALWAAVLNGCSTLQTTAPKLEKKITQKKLFKNDWTMHSKVGIKTQDNNGSARLVWNQMGDRYKASLSGPFGQSLGSLESDGQQVTLQSKDGQTQTANSEEELSLALIGKPLPITQLQFWIRGLKAPFYPIEPISSSADKLQFIQRGWTVTMDGFDNVQGYKLPKRLKLVYPNTYVNQQGIELNIVMKQWILPPKTLNK